VQTIPAVLATCLNRLPLSVNCVTQALSSCSLFQRRVLRVVICQQGRQNIKHNVPVKTKNRSLCKYSLISLSYISLVQKCSTQGDNLLHILTVKRTQSVKLSKKKTVSSELNWDWEFKHLQSPNRIRSSIKFELMTHPCTTVLRCEGNTMNFLQNCSSHDSPNIWFIQIHNFL